MDSRREFLKKASLLAGGSGLLNVLPPAIARAMMIDPAPGSTYLDAEHIVLLMQENRSFDHIYGTLQGVRGFNDPRVIRLPNQNLVWLQSNKEGETFAPFRFDIKNTKVTWMSSLPHSWSNQVDARNNGKYDGWLESKHSGHKEYAEMPLTLGYYTRADLPFYYSLADAFTICDHNFCSSLTGTTPNRLYFWTGTIREKADEHAQANVWNDDADYDTMVNWKTFPERLEENGVSWKIYQNELSVGVGFQGEEDAWLANFTDNPIEFFKQFNVKLHPEYISSLPKQATRLASELEKRKNELAAALADSAQAKKLTSEIDRISKQLATIVYDQKNFTKEKFDQLTEFEKNIHRKAFDTNRNDPNYHELTTITYQDGTTKRSVQVPKGDILHQFRQDVQNNQLPTVSWIVAPENFSDHPSSAWYGAWYISEVMDILTKNPEVWKKTIFILTYDENDGYYDHMPPFVAPHPYKKETGLVSKNISTAVEYVANASQQSNKSQARESSIGLGYRVPLVVASPWTRGGWVNSQVFDLTSPLQFLEKFLTHKLGKKIEESNITAWRRMVCGDLTSVFRPYNGEKLNKPEFLSRNEFIESIHKAQFKNPPSNYKKLTKEEITTINKNPLTTPLLPSQEKGIRTASALPYELYADGKLSADKKSFEILLQAGNKIFGDASAGSPFHIYAPGTYKGELVHVRSYGVQAGDQLSDSWVIDDFENGLYHLQVYGPNGFFREFKGNSAEPLLNIECSYLQIKNKSAQQLLLQIKNRSNESLVLDIIDNAYKAPARTASIGGAGSKNAAARIIVDTAKSYGWYDITVRAKRSNFEKRFAGHIESGAPSKTDPFMGRI